MFFNRTRARTCIKVLAVFCLAVLQTSSHAQENNPSPKNPNPAPLTGKEGGISSLDLAKEVRGDHDLDAEEVRTAREEVKRLAEERELKRAQFEEADTRYRRAHSRLADTLEKQLKVILREMEMARNEAQSQRPADEHMDASPSTNPFSKMPAPPASRSGVPFVSHSAGQIEQVSGSSPLSALPSGPPSSEPVANPFSKFPANSQGQADQASASSPFPAGPPPGMPAAPPSPQPH